jgi:hypothetical protein
MGRSNKDERELQRLGDYHENLDKEVTGAKSLLQRIERTLYGEPHARPEPVPGLVQQFDDFVRSVRRMKWAALFLLTILTTIGAFLADIGKGLISEGLSKKIFHSSAEEWKEQKGKKRIKKIHIVYTPNPRPNRTEITETKTQIIEEQYRYLKPQDAEP